MGQEVISDVFVCRVTFRSPENQAILNVLIKEVKGLNPSFSTQHINGTSFILSALFFSHLVIFLSLIFSSAIFGEYSK